MEKSKFFTNFAICDLLLDFSDNIGRDDNSSVHVQGSNAPGEWSRIEITRNNGQNIRSLFGSDC